MSNAINSSNIISQLGAGSGINVRDLATSLVDAERSPREDLINTRIDRSEAKITGIGAIRFGLSQLQTAFAALNQSSDFNGAAAATSSQSGAFTATATAQASTENHRVAVTQLAERQRSQLGSGFAASDSSLNNGNAMELQLTINGATETISIDPNDAESPYEATPQGIVSAINDADLGVNAQLMDTGTDGASRYQIVVNADQMGVDNAFSISAVDLSAQTAIGDLTESVNQPAQNAALTFNGINLSRSTNVIENVVPGVTLNLTAVTSGTATLTLSRDTADIKERFQNLVTAYNDFDDILDVLGDRDSEDEDFGGLLAGDQLLDTIRRQVREMFSYTEGDDRIVGGDGDDALRYGYQVGFTFNQNGELSLDESRLDEALNTRFDDVVTLFTNNNDIERQFGDDPMGLAADAARTLGTMLRNNSEQLLFRQQQSAETEITRYEDDLARLEERMDRLLARYMKQFAAMESIVGQSNSLRENLTSSFEGLMAVYTK